LKIWKKLVFFLQIKEKRRLCCNRKCWKSLIMKNFFGGKDPEKIGFSRGIATLLSSIELPMDAGERGQYFH
jgi:hypothetical protein